MRPAEKNGNIAVTIGRFGTVPEEVIVPKDSTVADALEEAGVEWEGDVFVNGIRAGRRDLLDNGDTINIVARKEAGL
jgi:UPF0288 family protein (methanogenesis marker protein 3)